MCCTVEALRKATAAAQRAHGTLDRLQGKALGPGRGEGAIMSLLTATCPALVLSDLNLSTLPSEVCWHSDHLTQLDLTSNALSDLPSGLSSCSLLQELSLDSNKFANIPDAVMKLRNLRVLQLAHNQIASIPEALTKLRHLALLALGDNLLTELPSSLARAASLTALDEYTAILLRNCSHQFALADLAVSC
jgi:Leucine-rich repeat (LRR) protein